MSVIKSLYIPFIEIYIDADFIMNLFYENNLATISRVTFENNGTAYKKAYVDIYEWHDSEIAYNFIQRLKNEKIETKLIYTDDDWWVVKINFKKESFYLNEETTFVNFLISTENEDNEEQIKREQEESKIMSNKRGLELLSYLNGANQSQDLKDWKEIENIIDLSLKCFRLEFSN